MVWEPKPTDSENEYFKRQDAEWLKQRRAELDAARAAKESEKKLTCPRCGTPTMSERSFNEVTIDVCDRCKGVWLDAGELNMLSHLSKGQLQFLVRSIDDE